MTIREINLKIDAYSLQIAKKIFFTIIMAVILFNVYSIVTFLNISLMGMLGAMTVILVVALVDTVELIDNYRYLARVRAEVIQDYEKIS